MAAQVWIGTRARAAYLRRLSVVFAFEIRLRIVSELYMREMSPTQFLEEFGGGSVARVDRHFKKLAESGWLRLIRTETGGDRRGGVEHFYRATELAIFDHESWDGLPYSIRIAFSWKILKQYVEQVRSAIEAGTFDARASAHLSHDHVELDERGWQRLTVELGAFFISMFEEQKDAWLRMQRTGERAMGVTIGLAAFETAGGRRGGEPVLAECERDSPVPFPLRLSKVLGDALSLRIIEEANVREISAPIFVTEIGGDSESAIRRRFRMLVEIGWLQQTKAKSGGRRRGAQEKFYRAAGPALSEHGPWSSVPPAVSRSEGWQATETISKEIRAAIRAGTFDSRTDRHFSWSSLRLDQHGWERITHALRALRSQILEEAAAAGERQGEEPNGPISVTVGLSAFELPAEHALMH